MTGIADAFDRLAACAPGRPLICAPGRAVTVAELDALARELDRAVHGRLPSRGGLVGLAAPNGPAFLAGLLALRRRGLTPVLLDPRAPAAEHRDRADALRATAVLHCDDGWAGAGAWSLDPVSPLGEGPTAQGLVKLSSGSTGAPQGILAPDACLLRDDEALRRSMGIREADRLLAAIPFSHSYGLSSLVIPALAGGLRLVLPEPGTVADPLAAAARLEATVFPSTPAYLHALVRRGGPGTLPATIRLVLSAGAPLAPETARGFREATGRSVHVFYGSTECGGICYDRRGDAAERGCVGTPVEGVTVDLEEGGDGAGRVVVRSGAVASRYHPEPSDRLRGGRFRTDDLARWEEGELRLVGRIGDWINVDGRKVNPREVESVLRQLEGVEDAAVCGVRVPERGGEILGALLVGVRWVDYERVVGWCRQRLPPHKVPRSIRWVEAIPSTGRGKVDRERVRSMMGSDGGT
ncbi:MAG: class I adenylate-forming enzyme family protein [Acidobacteriota bacterium]|jgi:long-chain acyl-CoA synthetase